MYKAFNKLIDGGQQQSKEEAKEQNAYFSYYLKLSKRSFLALKLNTQKRV